MGRNMGRKADLALRWIAAVPVGYAVATLWAMALTRILPMRMDEAATVGMLAAFPICAVSAMWAFAAHSGWRALWVLIVAGVVAGAMTWVGVATGGRL